MKPVIIIAIAFVLLIPTTVFAQPTDRCANLNPGALLMNCDLHGMDLSKKDLSGANLSGADLTNTDLTGVNLRYANLSGANLSGAILTNTDLSFAILTDALLTNTDLTNTDLTGAKLSGAKLINADLSGADLTPAGLDKYPPQIILNNADLTNAILTDAKLGGTDRRNADLKGVILTNADLSGAKLINAKLTDAGYGPYHQRTILIDAILTNADLSDAILSYVSLSGANLSGAILTNTDLSFANLSGAILTNTDLSGANLSGANLSGANLSGANIYSTNFAGVDIDDIIGLEDAVYNENSMENNKNDYTKNSDESQTNSLAKVKCGIGTMLKDGQCIVDTNYKTPEPTSEGGGCLIATATYGSELAPEVQKLRELRDNHLLNTESGTAFMGTFNDIYYSFSPIIADYERENPVFREMVKMAITPMISSLSILNYVDMNSEAEVLGYGISLILLNLGMYLGVPAIVIIGIRKKF